MLKKSCSTLSFLHDPVKLKETRLETLNAACSLMLTCIQCISLLEVKIIMTVVPETIHAYPLDGPWEFQGDGRSQRPKFLWESMKLNWNFHQGARHKPKTIHKGVQNNNFWN